MDSVHLRSVNCIPKLFDFISDMVVIHSWSHHILLFNSSDADPPLPLHTAGLRRRAGQKLLTLSVVGVDWGGYLQCSHLRRFWFLSG